MKTNAEPTDDEKKEKTDVYKRQLHIPCYVESAIISVNYH